ncbi:hypothetical protein NC652_018616 [Populus alba x Populus x berolinensis]|nr:hypothetical protein NC652_018616 [Populus alba x Populus x berolinensis]
MDKILFVHYILETAFSCQGLLNQMKQDLNLETVHLNVYRSIVELVYMQTSYLSFSSKSVFGLCKLDEEKTIAGTAIAHRWVKVKRNSMWDQVELAATPEVKTPSQSLFIRPDQSQHLLIASTATARGRGPCQLPCQPPPSATLPELTRPSAMLRPKMVKMDEELGAYSSQHLRLRRDAHRTLLGSYNQNSY